LCIAFGGDHLVDGNRVIQETLAHPARAMLRPHFVAIEALRLAQRHGDRAPDPVAACRLLGSGAPPVMTVDEQVRLVESIARAKGLLGSPRFNEVLGDEGVRSVVSGLLAAIKKEKPEWDRPEELMGVPWSPETSV
jgi:hypothetical protein